jgi:cytochrome b6-f complex iron-sulfur subunit
MSDPTPNITGNPPPPEQPAPSATTTTPAAPKPAAAVAKAPSAKAPGKGKTEERRGFLFAMIGSSFAVAWAAFAATMTVWVLGTLRFMVPNVLAEPSSRVKVGFPENFEEGKVVERFKDKNMWIVRNEGKIYALSTTCTHLGCTPNWLESAAKFKCPCHGSGFYISGINFEGPAPRPLERWAIAIGDDGQIVVDKSKKFQQERGEWSNPESFITT